MNRDITCERAEPDLTGYLLGALPAERESVVRAHLKTCERCRASAKELADTLDLLRGALAASPSDGATLTPERRVKVLAAKQPKIVALWTRFLFPAARAAALVLIPGILLAGLLLPAIQGGRQNATILGKLTDFDNDAIYATSPVAPATPAPAQQAQAASAPSDTSFARAPTTRAPDSSLALGTLTVSGKSDAGDAGSWQVAGNRERESVALSEKLNESSSRVTAGSRPASTPSPQAAEPAKPASGDSNGRLGDLSRKLAETTASPAGNTLGWADGMASTRADASRGTAHGYLADGAVALREQKPQSDAAAPAAAATADFELAGEAPAKLRESNVRAWFGSAGVGGGGGGAPSDQLARLEGEKVVAESHSYRGSAALADAQKERPSGASEVRKKLDDTHGGVNKAAQTLSTLAVTADGTKAAPGDTYVPLRPAMPKPMFVGTPVPAKAPNLEPPGTKPMYDTPAPILEGRALVATVQNGEERPAPPAAPSIVAAPAPTMPPPADPFAAGSPASGPMNAPAGSVNTTWDESGGFRRDEDAKRSADKKLAIHRTAGNDSAPEVLRRYKEAAETAPTAGAKYTWQFADTEGKGERKPADAKPQGDRRDNSTVLGSGGATKSGAGALTLGGINTYSGGTVVNGGTMYGLDARAAGPAAAAKPNAPAETAGRQVAGKDVLVVMTGGGVVVEKGLAAKEDRAQKELALETEADSSLRRKGGVDVSAGVPIVVNHFKKAELKAKGVEDESRLASDDSSKHVDQLKDLRETVETAAPVTVAATPPAPEEPTPTEHDGEKTPKFQAAGFNPVIEAAQNAFSTFSIDVDTASYSMARRSILEGRRPEPESVRTEEFVNSFEYDYAPPASGTFAVHVEGAPSPFRKSCDLLKIGVKAQRIGRDRNRGAVLTFVIDTSGSMNTPDRLGLIRRSLALVAGQLAPEDTVAIVTFNNRAALALEPTAAANRDAILAAVAGLETAGSTQLEGGLRLGYEVAARAFRSGASNRVILMSDGVANLGAGDAQSILRTVEDHRKQGIYCTVLGFGTGTYDDTMLEALADKGDGQYVFIDSIDEAKRVLVDDLAATLHTVARDVKIQVEFNPDRVLRWRQIGYENRRLEKEQFRDDTVDAGEVGSGQSVTALYEMELQGRPELPVATVRVRYRNVESGAVEEIEQRVTARDFTRDFAAASPRFRLAAGVAEFAELLRMSPYTFSGGRDFNDAAAVIRPVALELRLDERVQELARLMQAARSLPGL